MPEDWEHYLQSLSKKDRHELRRKFRRMDSSGEEVKLIKYSSPAEVDSNLEQFFILMRQSKEAKHRFLTPDRERFFRSVAGVLANMDVFRLFFLEMGEKPSGGGNVFRLWRRPAPVQQRLRPQLWLLQRRVAP